MKHITIKTWHYKIRKKLIKKQCFTNKPIYKQQKKFAYNKANFF